MSQKTVAQPSNPQKHCRVAGKMSLFFLLPILLLIAGCASEGGIRQSGFVDVFLSCTQREVDVPRCMTTSSSYKDFDVNQKAAIRDMAIIFNLYNTGEISLSEFQQKTKNTIDYYHRKSVYAAQQSNCRSAAVIGALGGMLSSSSSTLGGAVGDGAAAGGGVGSRC